MKKSILSLLLVLTMVVSTFAALPMTASAETTYPGGTLLYESFTGIVATGSATTATTTFQPAGTSAEIYRKKVGNDSGAGLGDYAMQNGNSTTNFSATVPTAYLGAYTDTAVVAAQGPNAKLTLEFDFKFDGEVPTEQKILTAVSIGNSSIAASSTGRGNAAVAVYLTAPNEVRFYYNTNSTKYDACYLPTGVTFDQWHRYQLAVDLTDENSVGATTYTFTVDGKNLVDAEGAEQASFTKKLSVNEITKLRLDTTTTYITGLDNISVYKTTNSYASLSTGELMTKLYEVNAKMEGYRTAAEGTSELEALESAVAAAGTMITTAYGTYDATGAVVDVAKTQADVNTALANLNKAQEELETHLSGITYPGGVLMYESFTGIEATGSATIATTTSQPKGTNATIYKKKVGSDSGAGLGDYARQSGNSASSVIAEFDDASYFGEYVDDTTTIDEVAAQGPNAKLTLEFDHRMESLDVEKQTADLRIMLGTNEMSGTMNSNGRANSAASVFLVYPNMVNVYYSGSSANTYYLPDDMTIEQWHRYQLTLNLTNEDSDGMSTFTFTVDGKNLVDENGNSQQNYDTILDSGAIAKAQLISNYADVNCVDNVSVYKTTDTYASLSTGELMTKLHEINAKMALYSAAAEGIAASQFAAFETAVAAAGTMVTTAFGTYDATTGEAVTPAKTQADIDAVLASLISAEASLKAVLPYYVISGHTIDDESGCITAVTVEEIKAYTGSPVKLIVATYDTDGLSEVSMVDFAGADVYELSKTLSVTNKEVAVFVWEMNDLEPLANTYYFGEAVEQD